MWVVWSGLVSIPLSVLQPGFSYFFSWRLAIVVERNVFTALDEMCRHLSPVLSSRGILPLVSRLAEYVTAVGFLGTSTLES